MFSSYKGVVFAGEPLSPRAAPLAREWGVELYEHTGVGDVTAAFECHAHDGLHFWEDTAFVEGLDPDGTEAVADGERGELVATSLFNRTAPLVRYRSDDIVRLTRDPCVCGRTHARMWPIGRKGDELIVDGRAVLPDRRVGRGRVGRRVRDGAVPSDPRPAREVDTLRLRVGYAPACERARAAVRDDVRGAVAAAIGVEPEVELVPERRTAASSARRTRSRGWRTMTVTRIVGRRLLRHRHARVPWEISQAEMQRDMGSAAQVLSELGVGAGKRVLFCSMLSEAGQFWPLIVGSMLAGAQLSCADATESDAARVAMFTRLLDYSAVLGVTGRPRRPRRARPLLRAMCSVAWPCSAPVPARTNGCGPRASCRTLRAVRPGARDRAGGDRSSVRECGRVAARRSKRRRVVVTVFAAARPT